MEENSENCLLSAPLVLVDSVVPVRSNHLHEVIHGGLQGQNAGVEVFAVETVPPYIPLHTLCPHQAAKY